MYLQSICCPPLVVSQIVRHSYFLLQYLTTQLQPEGSKNTKCAIDNKTSNSNSLATHPSVTLDLKNAHKDPNSKNGNDGGCGVGIFVEEKKDEEEDEIYMPAPDIYWHLWQL
jgi:hypothetical protein